MINHHSIVINAPAGEIFRELVLWGESEWWPSGLPMKYTRLTPGEIGPGTRYHQKVRVPFGPEWDVEVVSVTPVREVSRKFLNGMFDGVEHVYITPEEVSCEVHFMMDFEVVGMLDRLLWKLIFRKRHDENIRKILLALKAHMEGPSFVKGGVEEHPATPEGAERRRFLRGIIKK